MINTEGNVVVFKTFAYYQPDLKFRLFSPQTHFLLDGDTQGSFEIGYKSAAINLTNRGRVEFELEKHSAMPMAPAFHSVRRSANALANPNCVTSDTNQNLGIYQRLLLQAHYCLGHLGFNCLKWLGREGLWGINGIRFGKSEVEIPKCAACLYGGQERTPIKGNKHTQDNKGILKANKLEPGELIFSDQYVSSLPGRQYNNQGQEMRHRSFVGGTIFCDSASSYIEVHHQEGFTAHETVQSKLAFERTGSTVGVNVKRYCTDNGVYTSKLFGQSLEDNGQTIQHSGVGGHHHNGPAENAIKIVTRRARIMMFHAAIRWPDVADKALWPLAMQHAVYLHNHTPNPLNGLSPNEIWTKTVDNSRSAIFNAHTWGCPVYVLNPRLQDAQKLPMWSLDHLGVSIWEFLHVMQAL